MAPVSKSKAKPAKVSKATGTEAISFGSVNVTKEDVKTIAAMVRFGQVQGDAEHVSQKLGITKNAWNKRWKRVKTKLDFVTVETVDGPETGTNAEEISDMAPEYEELEPVLRPEDSDLPFF